MFLFPKAHFAFGFDACANKKARIMQNSSIERSLLVFAIWIAVGSLGILFIRHGFQTDSFIISLIGVACLIVAFVAHIILNAIYKSGFTRGETALGLTAYGFLALVFVVSSISGGLSRSDYHGGLALFAALVVGFVVYLVTRYGLRGSFSKFHVGKSEE
mgnify:CR=1 FL=1